MAARRGVNVKEELEALVELNTDQRWPTSRDPKPDTSSANHLRATAWLDEQEWPSSSNNYLSRKGHPLHRCDFERVLVCPLSHGCIALQQTATGVHGVEAVPPYRPSATKAAAWHGRATDAPPRAPCALSVQRRAHVIQGGESEQLDLDISRVSSMPRHDYEHLQAVMASHQRVNAMQQHIGAERAAQPAHNGLHRDVYATRLPEAHLKATPLAPRDRAVCPARRPGGFRPGSRAARQAAGLRPPTWPGSDSLSRPR